MTRLPLNEQGAVTLDASGSGFIALGPSYTAQTWIPSQLSVLITPQPTNEPVFKYYRGTAGPTSFLGGTYTGSNDTTDVNGIILNPGEKIFGVWTGQGSPGGVASMIINGELEVP